MTAVAPDGLHPAARATAVAAILLWAGCGGGDGGEPSGDDHHGRPAAAADPLARHLETLPVDSARAGSALSTLRRAVRLLERGRPGPALDSLQAASGELAAAADWLRMARARMRAEEGDTTRVRSLLTSSPDSLPAPGWAWPIRVTARERAGDPTGAARTALSAATEDADPDERARALLRAGRLWEEADSTERARAAWRRAADGTPGEDAGLEASEELVDRGELSPGEELTVGRVLAAHGIWWRAHPHFRRYLSSSGAPGGDVADRRVRLAYGRSLLHAGRYPGAIGVLEELVSADDPGLAAEAALLEGRARLSYRRPADGVERLSEVARRYPDRAEAGEALEALAEWAEEEGRPEEARRYWVRAYRHAASAREAELRLVRSAALTYMAGAYDSAAALFEERGGQALDEDARQRSLYWAGLAHRAAGRSDRGRALLEAALTLDRFDYYGSRAAEILARPLLSRDLPPGPWSTGRIERETSNAVLRLRVAEALPYDGAVEVEARRLEAHFARHRHGRYALAEAMSRSGFPLPGVRVAVGLRSEEEMNLRLLRLLYPFPHREEIRRMAAERGLSPYLLAGLIRQESLFEEEIESYAGAVGLMQIMPGTGRDLAREHGVRDFRVSDLREPGLNLRLGTGYLRELLDRFGGRLSFALAAYNAGPHRMARWRRRPYAGDPDVFMESIPFRQTRRYVKAVLAHARVYAALYGCGTQEPCLGREAAFALRDGGRSDSWGSSPAR